MAVRFRTPRFHIYNVFTNWHVLKNWGEYGKWCRKQNETGFASVTFTNEVIIELTNNVMVRFVGDKLNNQQSTSGYGVWLYVW
jgi:hypothetical protein